MGIIRGGSRPGWQVWINRSDFQRTVFDTIPVCTFTIRKRMLWISDVENWYQLLLIDFNRRFVLLYSGDRTQLSVAIPHLFDSMTHELRHITIVEGKTNPVAHSFWALNPVPTRSNPNLIAQGRREVQTLLRRDHSLPGSAFTAAWDWWYRFHEHGNHPKESRAELRTDKHW